MEEKGIVGIYTSSNLDVLHTFTVQDADESISNQKKVAEQEKWYNIIIQVSIPFFIAGIGTIGAGLIMADVTTNEVFREVQALYVLVPALLGLKGNLDMCLASRLSTQANLGNMRCRQELVKMVIGNISLVQVQAIVCSCIVSVFAVAGSALVNGNFKWLHTLLLATASTLTATLSCLTLETTQIIQIMPNANSIGGQVMIRLCTEHLYARAVMGVALKMSLCAWGLAHHHVWRLLCLCYMVLISIIMISHKMKLNPDNLATPMAASIGDVVSLATLSMWANFLYSIHDEYPWLMAGILVIYVFVLLPIWVIIVSNNKYTKMILLHGWTPVISALFISGSGGLILDLAVDEFKGYTVFQPIINGIGGNLVSVQASRISTLLHENSFKGVIPPQTKQWVAPWTALIKGVLPAKTARLLLLISIPGHAVFVYVADFIYNGVSTLTPVFILVYLLVGLVQLLLLLYVCHIMVHTIWKYRMDPDNSAIPYLTALGDLSGSTLLLAGFFFLRSIHQEYQPVG